MAIGAYCDNCKHKELEHKFDKWPCMDCCDGDRRDPVRNADRVRAMTDEEFANFIVHRDCCPGFFTGTFSDASRKKYGFDGRSERCECGECCYECWLDWLRQEAEEGE